MTSIPLDTTSTTDNCRYCLMCRHVCPVGHITHLETLTPHGWGLTIASVRRGLLAWNETTINNLYSCADCGCCRSHCVNDQPLPDAIAAARHEVVEQGDAPAVVYEIRGRLEKWGNPYREESPREPRGEGTEALFVGDDAAYLWPDALESARKLLRSQGVEPVEIGFGRSSGYIASSLGLLEAGRTLAQRTLDEIAAAGIRRVFVFSAGDYYTFHQLYAERLGLPWPEEVELTEISTYLNLQYQAGSLNFRSNEEDTLYAYVDPSHAVRVPGRDEAPRLLLAAVYPGRARELFWRRERAHPVGSTALQFTQPHIAQMLTRDRLDDARNHALELLVCEDPATLAALHPLAEAYGLQVRGLFEVLAEAAENLGG